MKNTKDKTDEGSQIIGHFGLGFYSAFMVSEKVTIDTLSWQPGSEAVKWTSTGGMEFEMDDSERTERGTTVTLYLADDSFEFLEYHKMREILEKYCSFMPFEIFLVDEEEEAKKADKEKKTEDKKEEDKGDAAGTEEDKPINDTQPLWLKAPKDCTQEEYKEFIKRCSTISMIPCSGYI